MVERGDCYFTEKARLVEKYDGLMMICYNTEGGESITMDAEGDNNDIVIPSVMISNAEGVCLCNVVACVSQVYTHVIVQARFCYTREWRIDEWVNAHMYTYLHVHVYMYLTTRV